MPNGVETSLHGPSEADIAQAEIVHRKVLSGIIPGLRNHVRGWRSRGLAALGGVSALLSVACSSGAPAVSPTETPRISTPTPEPPPPTPTIVPTETPTPPGPAPTATAIPPKEPESIVAPGEAQKPPAKEAEPQAECSFFKDPKFCELAEVFQGTNPRTGQFKGVGIKAPNDPSTVIEIVSPIDGWIQPILNNPLRADISTDKHRVVEGWIISGVKFNPTGRADATPIKKGQALGVLKDTGYRPLPYAQDYIAYFGPRADNIDAHIAENFPSAAAKPIKEVEFKSSGTKIEQGPVIVIER